MEYTFVNTSCDEHKLKLYSELLSMVFTDTKKYTTEFLKWQYDLNPNGKVVGFDAFYGDVLAAHYVTIPVVYNVNGKITKGLLSLNTVTHPDHQGKKLFTKLAERTYAYGAEQGYKFVIGVANQNSTHGFLNKLGFKLIAPLNVEIFPGKPKVKSVPENFMHSVWTVESVKWRLKNPSAHYGKTNLSVTSKTHMSFINAVLSCRKEIYWEGFNKHSSMLKMTIGLNNQNKLKINLPAFLKPSPLNLILKPLGDFSSEINSSNLLFEAIDFDAY